MKKPGFRRGSSGGGESFADQALGSAPFSQAQINHLMKTEFARARRYEYPVACVLMRADRIQALVELHGSELKGVVRRELAALVSDKTRGHDYVGLIADETHMLVLPHTDAAGARVVASRICESFRRLEVQIAGVRLPMSLSLGITACADKSTLFFDTFVAQAEVALDWAIADGGDQVVVFDRVRFTDPGTGLATDHQTTPDAGPGEPGPTAGDTHSSEARAGASGREPESQANTVRSHDEDPAGRRRKDDRNHPH